MESNVKSKQSAYLSRCNIGLKHLHRTMGLQATDKRRCWRMTHLDRDGSKLDACGFTKAVAAAIHELECDSSVNEVTAATQRLQHTQCMICIVRFLQNGTCALNHGVDAHDDMHHTTAGQNSLQQGNDQDQHVGHRRRRTSWTEQALAIAVACTYLDKNCVYNRQKRSSTTGGSSCALLWCQPGLVNVFWKSGNNHLKDLSPEETCAAASGARSYFRFQTDDCQDFQSAGAAACKNYLDLRVQLFYQVIDHVRADVPAQMVRGQVPFL